MVTITVTITIAIAIMSVNAANAGGVALASLQTATGASGSKRTIRPRRKLMSYGHDPLFDVVALDGQYLLITSV